MRPKSTLLTADTLRDLLSYNPDTGELRWRNPNGRHRAGVGHLDATNGYRQICVHGNRFRAHRLIWCWMTGEWPPPHLDVDHINGERCDNRWCNLRLANMSQQRANVAQKRGGNRSGFKGVRPNNSRWQAQMVEGGKIMNLGAFDTPEDAARAYDRAAVARWGEYAKTNQMLGLLSD